MNKAMTKEEKMKRLAENYERYQREAEEMLKDGKHIGTFSAWQFEKQLVDIKIPMTREEHFGKG